jgi:uncharacterized protein (TIGR02594 family)
MANYRSLVPGGFYSSSPYDKSVPVSIRTNNPGAVNGASWERSEPGYVTTDETTPGNKTTIFETPEHGVAVWWKLLQKYRAAGAVTVEQIIHRYGGGQDYAAYVDFVEEFSGLSRATKIMLNDDGVLLRFAKAMFRYEAGRPTPLLDAQILHGFALARGVNPAAPSPKASGPPWLARLLALFGRAVSAAPPPPASSMDLADRWLAISAAELGVKETPGPTSTKRILQYRAEAGCARKGDDGDVPWCRIYLVWVFARAGLPAAKNWMARAVESDPNFVKLAGPALGAVCSFWRGSRGGGLGHTGFYRGETVTKVLVEGGNENDAVRRAFYPKNGAAMGLVGYYWPRRVPLPAIAPIMLGDDGRPAASAR